MSTNPVLVARSRLGVATRRKDPQEIEAAKQALAAAKLEAQITRIVADAPPLTADQRHKLTGLLAGAGGDTHE